MRRTSRWTPKEQLLFDLRALGVPEPVPEYRFHPERRFRFDWAWPGKKVALEYDGIYSAKSRHLTKGGFSTDLDKFLLAQLEGWVVIRVGAAQVASGLAQEAVLAAMEKA